VTHAVRSQQGREWPLAVEIAADPDAVPTCVVCGVGAVVESFRVPADRRGEVAAFREPRFLGAKYDPPGVYLAAIYWTEQGVPAMAARTLVLTPGGDPLGAVISMLAVRRPDAVRLVKQHDSGTTTQGRNPR
jgi:hypothetical protein